MGIRSVGRIGQRSRPGPQARAGDRTSSVANAGLCPAPDDVGGVRPSSPDVHCDDRAVLAALVRHWAAMLRPPRRTQAVTSNGANPNTLSGHSLARGMKQPSSSTCWPASRRRARESAKVCPSCLLYVLQPCDLVRGRADDREVSRRAAPIWPHATSTTWSAKPNPGPGPSRRRSQKAVAARDAAALECAISRSSARGKRLRGGGGRPGTGARIETAGRPSRRRSQVVSRAGPGPRRALTAGARSRLCVGFHGHQNRTPS